MRLDLVLSVVIYQECRNLPGLLADRGRGRGHGG